jgi:protein-S-isoprenylcysteine O-methyltransferase Ste14
MPRSDLLLSLVLAALGIGMLAWLGYDLADDDGVAPLQVVARVASAVFWFGLAALAWSDRAKRTGLALAAAAVVVLLLTLVFGLLLVPDDFTNVTGKGPSTPEQARGLGVLLLLALVAGAGWLWQSRRR